MPRRTDPIDPAGHRRLGAYLFNRAWDLMAKKRRNRSEDEELLLTAYASRYHWSRVGRPLNFSIGEWQLSRVYSVLGQAEPALSHGRRSLELALRHGLGRFYVAYGYEALARASAVAGSSRASRRYMALARRVGKSIRDSHERSMLDEDLATIR